MKLRVLIAALAVLGTAAVPGALAVPPQVLGDPSLWLVKGTQRTQIPPAEPKVGDTIESTWATFHCDPSCDPNNPDADPTVGNREIRPSDVEPPAGITMAWERCASPNGTGCVVVRPRSSAPGADRYTLTDADAGQYIRSAVYATNLDCGYPRSYDNWQECKWSRAGVYSKLTPRIPLTVAIFPATLPAGRAGVPYTVPITAANGQGEYAFGVSGTLPPGMSFTAGAVQGTPLLAGVYTFTILAGAAGATPGSRTYTLRIDLGFPSTPPAQGTTGVSFSQPLAVVGANGAVTWALATGTLPPGLRIENGALVGVPTQRGSFAFELRATDSAGNTATVARTVEVLSPTLRAVNARLPKATRAKAYRAVLGITGGMAPYTVVLTAGRLPAGLVLRPNGVLAGKAREKTRKASFRFVVTATDRYGAETPMLFTLPYAGR